VATKIGGAFYFIFSAEYENIFDIERNEFIGNKAYIAASVYFYKITNIYLKKNLFRNNLAELHSNHVLSYPSKLIFQIEE